MRGKNFENIISPIIIFISITLLTYLGIYGTPFFRDFVIIFDGGYRIFQGIHPFVDFSLFPIPIPFYLQAFFNFIFGPNLIAMGAYSIFLSSILSIIFYFFSKRHFSVSLSIILSILFHYSFIGVYSFPWYNQVAFFFFLLNFFYIYHSTIKEIKLEKIFLFSSIFTLFTLFSKMDLGLIHLSLVFLYLILFYYKDRKKIFFKFVLPTGGIFILITFFINIISVKGFGFSKNLIFSRFTQIINFITLDNLVYSFSLYFLIALCYLVFSNIQQIRKLSVNSIKILTLIFILNIFILFSLILAGLPIQTKLLALPLTFLLSYVFIKNSYVKEGVRINKKIAKSFFIIIILFLLISQFSLISNSQSEFFKSPSKQLHYVFSKNIGYEREDFGCYKGILHEPEAYQDLLKIREQIISHGKDFIVLGEYTFLYCDYNINPPSNFPLWFHEGVTFDMDNFENIKNQIIEEKPNLIIEQIIMSKIRREDFGKYLIEKGYKKIGTFEAELSPINLYEIENNLNISLSSL